jgi:hypothetical protein
MTEGFRSGFGSGTLGKSLVFFKLPNYPNLLKISFHSMPVGEQIVVSGPLNILLARQSLSSPSSCSTFS